MADEIDWPVEPIPDDDKVFMRARQIHFREGQLQPGVFRQHGDGMSVDWEKYTTPQETKNRAQKPTENAVIAAVVRNIREVATLAEQHKPDHEGRNRAHSSVLGLPAQGSPELVEVRLKLLRISTNFLTQTRRQRATDQTSELVGSTEADIRARFGEPVSVMNTRWVYETVSGNPLPQEYAYDLVYRHGLDVDETGNRLVFGSTTGSL